MPPDPSVVLSLDSNREFGLVDFDAIFIYISIFKVAKKYLCLVCR